MSPNVYYVKLQLSGPSKAQCVATTPMEEVILAENYMDVLRLLIHNYELDERMQQVEIRNLGPLELTMSSEELEELEDANA